MSISVQSSSGCTRTCSPGADLGGEVVPELRRLVLVVPLELRVAGREVALLGAGRILVAADAGDQGVELVRGQDLLEGDRLQLVGHRHRVGRLVADAARRGPPG